MENVKLIAIDIDDTLLNDQKEIPQDNVEAIREAKSKGINVILASGRPYKHITSKLYEILGLKDKGNYYVAYNGESIYDTYTDECIYSNSLNKDDIDKLEKIFSKYNENVARYVHLDGEVVVINPNKYSYIEYEYNLIGYNIDDFNKINDIKAHKYQIAADPIIIKEIFNSITNELKEEYYITISMPCFVEIMKKGVDKYQGILRVSKLLNISEECIMSIGDSMNDYSMINKSAYSVAMGNAKNEIKKIAKIITDTNNNSGVGKIIRNIDYINKKFC